MTDHPHAPDLYARETADGGFSRGWGMHFMTSPDCFFDAHCHYHESHFPGCDIAEALESNRKDMEELELRRALILFKVYDSNGWQPEPGNVGPFFHIDQLLRHKEYFLSQDRFLWAPYFRYLDPNPGILWKSVDAGASCVKLHNAHIITDGADPEVWLSAAWDAMFREIEKTDLPVLWHVTQRRTECRYRKMGAESYWKDGVKKGISYSNRELLEVFLRVVEKYPKIRFVGAHQLHVGWEKLGELFDRYENLYTDTSTGCFLKPDDDFYPEDKAFLRDFFLRYADRILFATDIYYEKKSERDYKFHFENRGHMRFLNRLHLPDDVLQKVAWQNAEGLYLRKDLAYGKTF